MAAKPPITCHVLNTLSGKPAADLAVKLTLITPLPRKEQQQAQAQGQQQQQQQQGDHPVSFTATTNADGRVTQWEPVPPPPSSAGAATTTTTTTTAATATVQSVLDTFSGQNDDAAAAADKVAWSLTFDVGRWYEAQGIESFWPQVVVSFYVKPAAAQHYHVPVLVGPWTYTTYRGS